MPTLLTRPTFERLAEVRSQLIDQGFAPATPERPGVAGLFDEVDPDGADVVGDPLAFIEVAGHLLGVGQGSGDVDLGPWPAQPERFPRGPVPDQARGPSQRAHRCRC